jgi:hypothetical protein
LKIYLIHEGKEYPLFPKEDGTKAGLSNSICGCKCFYVVGSNPRYSTDGRNYEATGHCAQCEKVLGVIVAEPETIFGAREDDAVLQGRCRVY